MGIWGSCRSAGLRHADILICAVWIFSSARIRLSTLGIILPAVIIYAGDIIGGLDGPGSIAESAGEEIDRGRIEVRGTSFAPGSSIHTAVKGARGSKNGGRTAKTALSLFSPCKYTLSHDWMSTYQAANYKNPRIRAVPSALSVVVLISTRQRDPNEA